MRIPGGRRKSAMRRPDGPGRLMVGFEGKAVPPRLARWLREGTVCGVVLFSRNVEAPRQVRDLCREIRAAAGRGRPAPLVAVGETMAEELRAVGVDINFAPVLDVDSNPENPVIGDRALSSNPEIVAELGI